MTNVIIKIIIITILKQQLLHALSPTTFAPSMVANKATKTSVKGSTNNLNHEQINKNNDDEITSVTPDDGKFNSVDPFKEPVSQVITEGISPASDTVFTFMKCLLNSGRTKSLIPLSRLPRSFQKHKSVTLPCHHQTYISIISTLHFTIYVSPNSAPISGWKMSNYIFSTTANFAPTTSSLGETSYSNSDSS